MAQQPHDDTIDEAANEAAAARPSLRRRFGRASRKTMRYLTATTALTLAFAGGYHLLRDKAAQKPAADKTVSATPEQTQSRITTQKRSLSREAVSLHPDSITDDVRDEINSLLVYNAQMDYSRISAGVYNTYSLYLDSLQAALNERLNLVDAHMRGQIIVLDPLINADIPISLGVEQRMSIREDIARRNIYSTPEYLLDSLSAYIANVFVSPYGTDIYAQKPYTVYPLFDKEPAPVIIVPSGNDAGAYRIPGLSHPQAVKFVSEHEGWHGVDTRYTYHDIDEQRLHHMDFTDARTMVNNPEGIKFLHVHHKREAFADVAAAGEAVRHGGNPDAIGHIAALRRDVSSSVPHMTDKALDGLRRDIDVMGIGNFRRLSTSEAIGFYYDIVEANILDAQELAQVYDYLDRSPHNRTLLRGSGLKQDIQDFASRIEKHGYYTRNRESFPDMVADLSMQVMRALSAWDPMKALTDRAFAIGESVTPYSMVYAYAGLQSDLWQQSLRDPENRLYPEQMTLLKKTLVENLTSLDYVAVNNQYRVTPAMLVKNHLTF